MLIQFTLYIENAPPDPGDLVIDAHMIYSVCNMDAGKIPLAALCLRNSSKVLVYDFARNAAQRWANATGEMVLEEEG